MSTGVTSRFITNVDIRVLAILWAIFFRLSLSIIFSRHSFFSILLSRSLSNTISRLSLFSNFLGCSSRKSFPSVFFLRRKHFFQPKKQIKISLLIYIERAATKDSCGPTVNTDHGFIMEMISIAVIISVGTSLVLPIRTPICFMESMTIALMVEAASPVITP